MYHRQDFESLHEIILPVYRPVWPTASENALSLHARYTENLHYNHNYIVQLRNSKNAVMYFDTTFEKLISMSACTGQKFYYLQIFSS